MTAFSISETAGGFMSESADLISRIQAGDAAAFREIYDEHRLFVFRFVYAMVREHDIAEELTQETFVRAFTAIKSMRNESTISTWLGGIARNVCLTSFRGKAQNRANVVIDDTAVLAIESREKGPDRVLLDGELNKVIDTALARLPEDRRLIFVLKVLEQLSYEEISEILGHSIGKLKTDVHRARLEMRQSIGQYLEVQG
jgi:RNA polymerase sigma-70 factor (ECF subfamily)